MKSTVVNKKSFPFIFSLPHLHSISSSLFDSFSVDRCWSEEKQCRSRINSRSIRLVLHFNQRLTNFDGVFLLYCWSSIVLFAQTRDHWNNPQVCFNHFRLSSKNDIDRVNWKRDLISRKTSIFTQTYRLSC